MIREDVVIAVSSMIRECISLGFTPDDHTLDFIKSAYGLDVPDEILLFIEDGNDGGAVIDLVSYPTDKFREEIEMLIPAKGFSAIDIKQIEDYLTALSGRCFLQLNSGKIFLSERDSIYCYTRFLQRLNPGLSLDYLSELKSSEHRGVVIPVMASLRKKNFISNHECSIFMKDLVSNYCHAEDLSQKELILPGLPGGESLNASTTAVTYNSSELYELVEVSADMLSGSDKKPFDILSEKKDYFESSVLEAEEFSRLMKNYSMEFIMMKRIQPPLISVDQARYMIRVIDRLTSIVYGVVNPSIRNILIDELI